MKVKLSEENGDKVQQKNTVLIDGFGRIAKKLRISLTDRCNMRCMYCMPLGDVQWFKKEDILTYDEIIRLVSIVVKMGIEKVRLTGGEPLLRPRLEEFINSLRMITGIRSISMTTNGLLLAQNVKQLKDAGLDSVNVSLDSFKADRFKAITGIDGIHKVIDGIDAANTAGLKVKVNTVVIRGWNDDEIVNFAEFARTSGYTVRFIEFMPLDGSGIWQPNLVLSKKEMIEIITRNVKEIVASDNYRNNHDIHSEAEPAKIYSFVDGKGTIGFISSMTEPFCANCDRIRLTSDGRLLTCLFENPGYDIRSMLRSGKSEYDIEKYLLENIKKKPEGIVKITNTNILKPSLNLMHTIGG
jgi:GTP 3',8-cyclase